MTALLADKESRTERAIDLARLSRSIPLCRGWAGATLEPRTFSVVVALGERVGFVADRMRQANVEGGRTVRREVRLSELEDNALLVAANQQGMTVQRFLVESALAQDHGETMTERRESLTRLMQLHGQLAAIGNNLNQLTKTVNATGEVGRELTHSLAYLHRAVGAVTEAAETISKDQRSQNRKLSETS